MPVRANLEPTSSNDDYGRVPDEGQFIVYQGTLYFAGHSTDEGTTLWRTDGTEAGTYAIADKNGDQIPAPHNMIVQDNLIYFIADWYPRLFISDGTPEGTSGGGPTRIWSKFTAYHGNLYYLNSNMEPDYYSLGMIVISPPSPGLPSNIELNQSFDIFAVNDLLCFSAQEKPSAGGHGWELWCMGGNGEAWMVKDINPNGDLFPLSPYAYAGNLYFSADDGNGRKLWRTDGTAAGTQVVQDLDLGPEDFFGYRYLGVVGGDQGQPGRLVFVTQTADNQLWSTDGTTQGTVQIGAGVDTNNLFQALLNGRLYYTGVDLAHGVELWRTDGSVQGTALLQDIWPGERGSLPWALEGCGDRLCFAADDGQHGKELWVTDGTQAGTKMVMDMNTAPSDSSPWSFTKAEDQVFFIAKDQVSANNLWRTDGTQAGTIALNQDPTVSIVGLTDLYQPRLLLAVGSNVYFSASDPTHGQELWHSDGTPEGTKMLKDIYPGSTGSMPYLPVAAGKRIFFTVNNPNSGQELWVSDGSETGTLLVKSLNQNGEEYIGLHDMAPIGESVVYALCDWQTLECSLWVSDGSEAGTTNIGGFVWIRYMVEVGGKVFFAGRETNSSRDQIYVTDGTESGTKQVSNDNYFSGVSALYSAGERVYIVDSDGYYFFLFAIDVDLNGIGGIHLLQPLYIMGKSAAPQCVAFEGKLACTVQAMDGYTFPIGEVSLWMSDGTYYGTRQISGDFSWPTQLVGKGSTLAFMADTPGEGRQIWETDGTLGGTRQGSHFSQSICGQTSLSSWPHSLAYLKGQYLLALDDTGSNPAHGCELWALDMRLPQAFLPVVTR